MQRLTMEQWDNIIRNTREENEEVEILWLDDTNEYVLACEYELFEDGFKSEEEARERLQSILNRLKKL